MFPESISNQTATGTMEVLWPDGTRQQLSHPFLRKNCPCADCKAARLSEGKAPTVSADIRITDIVPVGVYAVQLIFSDGHVRGIFPWPYLNGLANL